MPNKVLITGSSGLIGAEAATFFDDMGWEVFGVDNNLRRTFFGQMGDTTSVLSRLKEQCKNFKHFDLDIRDRTGVLSLFESQSKSFDLIIHCAAQPSHDFAASDPFLDFDVNAVGTMNMLEAFRLFASDAVFIHMSTNKVYGDTPNRMPLKELATRWEYAEESDYEGIDESMTIDHSTHSLFGASKVAGDVMAQEYGRYFGLKTCVFRGGCLAGPLHSGAELHGFLSYLIRAAALRKPYRIFGYNGKQVRDNIHSEDVIRAMLAVYQNPKCGEVYNLGGMRQNSISMIEAIQKAEKIVGHPMNYSYVEENRIGDHICYISDMSKFKKHYPDWDLTKTLDQIMIEIYESVKKGMESGQLATTP